MGVPPPPPGSSPSVTQVTYIKNRTEVAGELEDVSYFNFLHFCTFLVLPGIVVRLRISQGPVGPVGPCDVPFFQYNKRLTSINHL